MTDIHDLEGRTPEGCFELAREALTQAEKVVNSATSTLECAKAQAAASIAIGWARLGDALAGAIPELVRFEAGHKLMGVEPMPLARAAKAHRWPSPFRDGKILDAKDVRCLHCGRCSTHPGAECIGGSESLPCLVCAEEPPKRHKFPPTIRQGQSECLYCGADYYNGPKVLTEECFGPAVVEPASDEPIDTDEVPDSSAHEHSVGCHHHWISPGEPCRECRQSQKRNQERCPNACPEPGEWWVHLPGESRTRTRHNPFESE